MSLALVLFLHERILSKTGSNKYSKVFLGRKKEKKAFSGDKVGILRKESSCSLAQSCWGRR